MNILMTDYAPVMKFDLSDPNSIREADFQEDVLRILQYLHPGDWVFKFNPRVEHDGAVWKPDLALVDRQFRFWYVIEVEVAYHSLEKHVIPQSTAFVQGTYGEDSIRAVAKATQQDQSNAATFVKYVPKQVVVISNKADEIWSSKLRSEGVQHLAVSSFRNRASGQLAHRISGALEAPSHYLGFGRVDEQTGAIVTDALRFGDLGDFGAVGPDGFSEWQTVVANGKAWLFKKQGPIGLPHNAYVQILRRNDGIFEMRLVY